MTNEEKKDFLGVFASVAGYVRFTFEEYLYCKVNGASHSKLFRSQAAIRFCFIKHVKHILYGKHKIIRISACRTRCFLSCA